MDKKAHYIRCPRYGGRRAAPACIIYDRYKRCRKTCKSLEKHLEEHPDLVKEAKDLLEKKSPTLRQGALFAGRDLPDGELRCEGCGFQANSLRGLKLHKAKSHKKARAK